MFKTFVASIVAAGATTLLPGAANAVTIALDHPAQSVVRPDTGSIQVDFTGHIGLTAGYELLYVKVDFAEDDAGDHLSLPSVNSGPFGWATDGVLFSETVRSTNAPGLYGPVVIEYGECADDTCIYAETTYSVEVTSPVDEAETIALMGLGLLGLAGARRKASAPRARPPR